MLEEAFWGCQSAFAPEFAATPLAAFVIVLEWS